MSFAAFPAVSASIKTLAVHCHVAKVKAAVEQVRHRYPVDAAGDPPDHNVGTLNSLQGQLLHQDIRLFGASEGSLGSPQF